MKNNEIHLFPNKMYHIYNHANGKENIFENDGNFSYFLKRYQYYVEPIAETFAYCLMPNHLHLMVRIKDDAELQKAHMEFQKDKNVPLENITSIHVEQFPAFISKTFGNLFSAYTQAFNKQQKRKGSLFMPNFKRKEIENESYYAQLIYYIHNNPVHHCFVDKMEDWSFSSYNAYLSDKNTKIKKEEVLSWFGDTKEFVAYHSLQNKLPESSKLSGS